jgi:hypothetical protein
VREAWRTRVHRLARPLRAPKRDLVQARDSPTASLAYLTAAICGAKVGLRVPKTSMRKKKLSVQMN